MNDRFDELAMSMGQSVRLTFLCLAVTAQIAVSARANDFRPGRLIDLSDPDAFAACGSNGAEKETSVAANPTNPKNLVATWIAGLFKGIGGAVSLDGGKRWQQVLIPGLSICSGGTQDFDNNADPWLSFAPNGDLYHLCLGGNSSGRNVVLVSKSADGGLHWAAPAVLWDIRLMSCLMELWWTFSPSSNSQTMGPTRERCCRSSVRPTRAKTGRSQS